MSTSRAKRALDAARLLMSLGTRHLFEKVDSKADTDTQRTAENQSSQHIREKFGAMRGVTAKVAQMASYLDTRVPQDTRDALSQFQDNAVGIEWNQAKQVIENDLGVKLKELFKEFEETPFAAASIGQVHRAVTRNGDLVAVKVQYPEAREAIVADLKNSQSLAAMLKWIFPSMDVKDMSEEISSRILEELDYIHEANVQELFYHYYEGHPTIVVPKVYKESSGATVLTTEYIEGLNFYNALNESQSQLDSFGETIFRFVFRSLYRLKTFNGDPHPGNYIFLPNGQVAFLDFGFSRSFSQSEISKFMEMIHYAVIDPSPKRFRDTIENNGLLRPNAPVSDAEVYDYFAPYYRIVKEAIPMTITEEYSNSLLSHSFDRKSSLSKYVNVPKSFVVVQRINLGLYAILAQMKATSNWRKVAEEIWPFVLGEPSTPIGEEEQRWMKAREHPDSKQPGY